MMRHHIRGRRKLTPRQQKLRDIVRLAETRVNVLTEGISATLKYVYDEESYKIVRYLTVSMLEPALAELKAAERALYPAKPNPKKRPRKQK